MRISSEKKRPVMRRIPETVPVQRLHRRENSIYPVSYTHLAVNPAADVIFEDSNGEIDEIFEEDLPYDLSQDPIVLEMCIRDRN